MKWRLRGWWSYASTRAQCKSVTPKNLPLPLHEIEQTFHRVTGLQRVEGNIDRTTRPGVLVLGRRRVFARPRLPVHLRLVTLIRGLLPFTFGSAGGRPLREV